MGLLWDYSDHFGTRGPQWGCGFVRPLWVCGTYMGLRAHGTIGSDSGTTGGLCYAWTMGSLEDDGTM